VKSILLAVAIRDEIREGGCYQGHQQDSNKCCFLGSIMYQVLYSHYHSTLMQHAPLMFVVRDPSLDFKM
jgi:hypothetical protein